MERLGAFHVDACDTGSSWSRRMRKIAVLLFLLFGSAALTTATDAKTDRRKPLVTQDHARKSESLTKIGTPDCHAQGRLLRAANHCPPAAIAAAPR
jgi:hypothetical protein